MADAAPNHRCWSQFTIRMMFLVITAIAIWLGWELQSIRKRKSLIQEIVGAGGLVGATYDLDPEGGYHGTIPLWRYWLGDVEVIFVAVADEATTEEFRRVGSAFPEAQECVRNATYFGFEHKTYSHR